MLNVSLSKENNLKLSLDGDYNLLREIKEYFTKYAPGYLFHPKYKAGVWNGKVCLMDISKKELPYGLLYDLLNFKKKKKIEDTWTFSEEVKSLFRNDNDYTVTFGLKLMPRDYQKKCILEALRLKKGIFRVGTGGGKSLIITYICDNLFKNKLCSKFLIMVPNLNLITQFKSDMIEYGIDENRIGEVWAKTKEWDKEIVISTWQSLSNNDDKLETFDACIVDECHGASAMVVRDLLSKLKNAEYRWACTGTLSDEEIDTLNVRSYLGPVFKEYSTKFLTDSGYLVECQVNQIILHYKNKFKGDFFKVKDEIFKNEFRMHRIKECLKSVDDNLILMLVNKVEDEGQMFLEYLRQDKDLDDVEIVFLSGKIKKDEREYWRKQAILNNKRLWIISTYPIFQAGVNIPGLSNVFFLSPTKSKIRLLQSVGRALRLYMKDDFTKEKAYIWDFIDDQNKWFEKHSEIRERHYYREGFTINSSEFNEKDFDSFF